VVAYLVLRNPVAPRPKLLFRRASEFIHAGGDGFQDLLQGVQRRDAASRNQEKTDRMNRIYRIKSSCSSISASCSSCSSCQFHSESERFFDIGESARIAQLPRKDWIFVFQ
jgi:hypothetical protein